MSRYNDGNNRFKNQGNCQVNRDHQQNNNNLKAGLCGLFFTVDGDEKRAAREARNLIDHFIVISKAEAATSQQLMHTEMVETTSDQQQFDKNDANKSDSQEDISDSLTSACQEIRQEPTSVRHVRGTGIRQLITGARCSLFFTSPSINATNVYNLAEQMIENCQQESQSRFLARVIPVEKTCSAYMDQILSSLSVMIEKRLRNNMTTSDTDLKSSSPSPTYAIDFKASNTKLLKREQIYEEVTKLMKEHSPGSSVNLTQPDLLIVVHAIRTIVLLSIVRNYYQRRKFSLRKPTENDSEEVKKTTTIGNEKVEEEE